VPRMTMAITMVVIITVSFDFTFSFTLEKRIQSNPSFRLMSRDRIRNKSMSELSQNNIEEEESDPPPSINNNSNNNSMKDEIDNASDVEELSTEKQEKNDFSGTTESSCPKPTPLDRILERERRKRETVASVVRSFTGRPLAESVHRIDTPLQSHTPEYQLEKGLSELTSNLSQAVQRNDFSTAAKLQKEVDTMHLDDSARVLQLHDQFYKAFSSRDAKLMSKVWMQDERVVQCIHPQHKPLHGYAAVLSSFQEFFQLGDSNVNRNRLEPSQIKLSVRGSTAFITCDEDLYMWDTDNLIRKMMATNIFRRIDDKWSLVHRHAVFHVDNDTVEQNVRGGNNHSTTPMSKQLIEKITKTVDWKALYGSPPPATQGGAGGTSSEDDLARLSELFGGTMGSIEGGSIPSSGLENAVGKGKVRIFRGTIGDLLKLNGNGDLPTGQGEEIDAQATPYTEDDEEERETILEDTTDDEEEEEEILDESDDGSEDQWMEGASNEDGGEEEVEEEEEEAISSNPHMKKQKLSVTESSMYNASNIRKPKKDMLRQSCISALRRLSNQGGISSKQKRVLLTDIITCSAKGEYSMVEVAYEMLCLESATNAESEYDDDEDAALAEEEFADQCRVFADKMSD